MKPEIMRFEAIKEDREWYFVEYHPPLHGYPFSMLNLTVMEQRSVEAIAETIELEVRHWLLRYPVPIMAAAFSVEDDLIHLEPIRPIDHLMGWIRSSDSTPILRWELVTSARLPTVGLDKKMLREIFAGVPFRTKVDFRADTEEYVSQIRMAKRFLFVWYGLVPLIIAIVEWSSEVLGHILLGYACVSFLIACLRYFGRVPQSKRQLASEERERKMKHYFYHCERNPEMFEQLKLENLRRETIERTAAEYESIKLKKLKKPNDDSSSSGNAA